MKRTLSRNLKSSAVAVVIGATLVMLTASQAMAAVTMSISTANAVGGNVVNTGTCTNANGGTPTSTAGSGAINVTLGCSGTGGPTNAGTLLSAGVLVQTGSSDDLGSSSACAGLTGAGGAAITLIATDQCTGISNGTSGVTLLGGLITATAIYSVCNITAGGTPTATPTIVGLGTGTVLGLSLLGSLTGLGSITNPTPTAGGTTTTIGFTPLLGSAVSILSLTLNNVTTADGQIMAQALSVTVLGGLVGLSSLLGVLGLPTTVTSGLTITIGTVTCGPNALVPATSALPGKALPIAGGVLILAAGGAYIGRRRLFAGFRG